MLKLYELQEHYSNVVIILGKALPDTFIKDHINLHHIAENDIHLTMVLVAFAITNFQWYRPCNHFFFNKCHSETHLKPNEVDCWCTCVTTFWTVKIGVLCTFRWPTMCATKIDVNCVTCILPISSFLPLLDAVGSKI